MSGRVYRIKNNENSCNEKRFTARQPVPVERMRRQRINTRSHTNPNPDAYADTQPHADARQLESGVVG